MSPAPRRSTSATARCGARCMLFACTLSLGCQRYAIEHGGGKDSTGTPILTATRIFPASPDTVFATLSPDASRAAIFHDDGAISLIDTQTTRILGRYTPPTKDFALQGKFCDHGRYLVVVRGPLNMTILDAAKFPAHTIVDFGRFTSALPESPTANAYLQTGGGTSWDCAANAPAAIVHFSATKKNPSSGFSVLLNLETGAELQRIPDPATADQINRILLSPSATRAALLMHRKPEIVVDKSGRRTLKSHSFDGDNYLTVLDLTDHSTHPTDLLDPETNDGVRTMVAFAGDDAIATLAPYIDLPSSEQQQRICLFDTTTGHRIATFGDPAAPPDFDMGASADGRTIFAYTGKTQHGQGGWKFDDPSFTLWDRATGRPIAVSPQLLLVHVKCPRFMIMGSCTEHDDPPSLEMDQTGNAVIAYTSSLGEPSIEVQPVRIFTLH